MSIINYYTMIFKYLSVFNLRTDREEVSEVNLRACTSKSVITRASERLPS